MNSLEKQGIVISRYGNRAEIEDTSGQTFQCHIRRALEELVTGDRVIWQLNDAEDADVQGVIVAIQPRSSVLERPIRYQGVKAVAANIDQILVVTAIEPPFSSRILDRYLVAIEQTGIQGVLVLNKTDRLDRDAPIYETLNYYHNLGYPVIHCSCKQQSGLEELQTILKDKTSVIVGQSGVGKSSIANCLLPSLDTAVSGLSEASGLGTHTTTTSRLYHLPFGGILIDSPGIREFGMDHLDTEMIADGFIEIANLAEQCKFRNCHHLREPGCAVKAGVESGEISQVRYDSYINLYQEADKPQRSG